ncbi:MAG TPA: DUF4440 domain-containing protein [Polyangiaceae bacterium]|nr:DUF4440 domain-containing protein [Polyangiaceae bacterium]
MEGARQDIHKLLQQLAAAYREGDVEAFRGLHDERAVFAEPGLGRRLVGREACVERFRRFVGSVEMLDYSDDEAHVEAWADTAVATYRVRMAFAPPGGEVRRETGRDIVTLRRKAGRWLVVWRTSLPGA